MPCVCCAPACECSNAYLQTNVSSISWQAFFSTQTKSETVTVQLGLQTDFNGTTTNNPNVFQVKKWFELPLGDPPFIPDVFPKPDKRYGFAELIFRRCPLDFLFSWSEYVAVTNPTFVTPGIGACRNSTPVPGLGCTMIVGASQNILMGGVGGRGNELFSPQANRTWLQITDPYCENIESVQKTLANASASITFQFNPLP